MLEGIGGVIMLGGALAFLAGYPQGVLALAGGLLIVFAKLKIEGEDEES